MLQPRRPPLLRPRRGPWRRRQRGRYLYRSLGVGRARGHPRADLANAGGHAASDVNFSTPDYNALAWLASTQTALSSRGPAPLLDAGGAGQLLGSRDTAEKGFLHFTGLAPDRRIPLSYSRGLPNGTVATWDGRWLVRDCRPAGRGGGGDPPALPAPEPRSLVDPSALALVSADVAAGVSASVGVSVTVAELTSSVGYLRFSKPVVLRSLFARWQPRQDASPAIIGGRLGLDRVWAAHLDPSTFSGRQGWVDVAGSSLEAVDEVAFLGAAGLELGAMEVVTSQGGQQSDQSVLLLSHLGQQAAEGSEERPIFALRVQTLSPAASPFIVSLQEAIDKRLKIVPRQNYTGFVPSARHEHVPGVVAGGDDTLYRVPAVSANHDMFTHQLLLRLLSESRLPRAAPTRAFLGALTDPSAGFLPDDLRRELARQRDDVSEAILGWHSAGGRWRAGTPATLPWKGTEQALGKYMTAKRWQTKLDLITAAFLHATKRAP